MEGEEYGGVQHTKEANQGDGNQGRHIPDEAKSDKGPDARDGDDGPALTWPLMINLRSKSEAAAVFGAVGLGRGDGVDQEVAWKTSGVKVQAVGPKGQREEAQRQRC